MALNFTKKLKNLNLKQILGFLFVLISFAIVGFTANSLINSPWTPFHNFASFFQGHQSFIFMFKMFVLPPTLVTASILLFFSKPHAKDKKSLYIFLALLTFSTGFGYTYFDKSLIINLPAFLSLLATVAVGFMLLNYSTNKKKILLGISVFLAMLNVTIAMQNTFGALDNKNPDQRVFTNGILNLFGQALIKPVNLVVQQMPAEEVAGLYFNYETEPSALGYKQTKDDYVSFLKENEISGAKRPPVKLGVVNNILSDFFTKHEAKFYWIFSILFFFIAQTVSLVSMFLCVLTLRVFKIYK